MKYEIRKGNISEVTTTCVKKTGDLKSSYHIFKFATLLSEGKRVDTLETPRFPPRDDECARFFRDRDAQPMDEQHARDDEYARFFRDRDSQPIDGQQARGDGAAGDNTSSSPLVPIALILVGLFALYIGYRVVHHYSHPQREN